MEYKAPFGSVDPDASYIDKNTPGAVVGSKVPGLALEMPQREIVDVIEEAGMTPADVLQLADAIKALAAGFGVPAVGGYLAYVSATALQLKPTNGGRLWINGKNETVPASLTIANTGLAATTNYFVYAYMTGGTMALEISATGYTLAANGIPQKTGDATRTLVGRIRTQGSTPGQFQNQGLGTISYFNRRAVYSASNGSQTGSTGAITAAELNAAARAGFLTWADEAFNLSITGFGSNAAASISIFSGIGLDGTVISQTVEQSDDTAGSKHNISQTLTYSAAEGYHYCTPMGATGNVSGTANFDGLGSSVQVRG